MITVQDGIQLEVIQQLATSRREQSSPIVFVHGAWMGAWCWKEYQSYFAAQGYDTYAVNLRGHGGSDGRDRIRWWRIADYVADVRAVVKQIGSEPVLVGHSMGGFIIQKYMEQYPLTRGVLLASIPVIGMRNVFARFFTHHPLAFLRSVLTGNTFTIVRKKKAAANSLFAEESKQNIVQAAFKKLQPESFRAFLDMLVFNLPRGKKTKTSLFVVAAEHDRYIHPRELQKTAEVYGGEFLFQPHMGHAMMLEAEWRKTAQAIGDWLT